MSKDVTPVEKTEDELDGAPESPDDESPDASSTSAYGCSVSYSRGQRVIHPDRGTWAEVAAALLADGWNMCVDVTAVDYSTYDGSRDLPDGVAPERFELIASFISHTTRDRLRARVQIPADDPVVSSLYHLYPGTDYLEREVFDLMGIAFDGHPDLSRILMPENWDGHPLRKDYAVGAIPVQFKATAAASTGTGPEAQR